MATISGGIFNFYLDDYAAPTWSGVETHNFGSEFAILYQVHTEAGLIYTATNVGLKIYDMASEDLYAYINRDNGFSAVCGTGTDIYLGTHYNGLKRLSVACVSGSTDTPIDLAICLTDFAEQLTSSGIRYLHAISNHVGVCTTSGIDYIRTGSQGYLSSATISGGAYKCFVTTRDMYYTLSGSEWSLNKVGTRSSLYNTSASYVTGSGIFNAGIQLTNIHITEGTAEYSANTIFCSTSSGVYVIDEDLMVYSIYYTR